MKRYWFEFNNDQLPLCLTLGCGITAYDYDDAVHLLDKALFKGKFVPIPNKVIENIDVSTLDDSHVLLNMASPDIRGIWYPLGYS